MVEKFSLPKYQQATIIKILKSDIKKIDMSLCNNPRETLSNFYNRQKIKPDLLINGGFFSMTDGVTCFTFKDEGSFVVNTKQYPKGMGVLGEAYLSYGTYDDSWRDFISAYPVLIENGSAVPITFANEINYKARRTAIGFNEKEIIIVLAELPGLDFKDLQEIFLAVGAKYAINLDGGGSTKALWQGECITSTAYNRAVDNVIAFYLQEKYLYRVQLGAFSSKQNAEKLLEKIKSLPDNLNIGYKNAYIKLVGGLYKVQVGAYSIKANAEKVVADLRAKGYDSFIQTEIQKYSF